jgi:hypothetical protein
LTPKKKHEDTSVSLHPLSFRKAVKKLAETPPEKPSRRTKLAAPGGLALRLLLVGGERKDGERFPAFVSDEHKHSVARL